MKTLGALLLDVLKRLGDVQEQVWSQDEVTGHLRAGYQELATATPVFWDQTFLEDLPPTFTYTAKWERAVIAARPGFVNGGCANYTFAAEEDSFSGSWKPIGPAHYTCSREVDHLASVAADTAVPATAELPPSVVSLDRATWDGRGIVALKARQMAQRDSRYELTEGEVYGYLWELDGVRTFRKVCVPAAMSDRVTVTGSWGIARSVTDLSAATVTGSWGVPRRIPGHHPIGPDLFGLPRRPFLDGKNVRVEHFRYGRVMDRTTTVCELPDRYARYLRDYAQAQCLARVGPGQDLALAKHFAERWARALTRVARRVQLVDTERVFVMGGQATAVSQGPPRPRLPWNYGQRVR